MIEGFYIDQILLIFWQISAIVWILGIFFFDLLCAIIINLLKIVL